MSSYMVTSIEFDASLVQRTTPAPRNTSRYSTKVFLLPALTVLKDVCLGIVPPRLTLDYSTAEARVARSARATKVGGLRPAIVLYDEPHPLGDDIGAIQGSDITRKPDMLIIMGTSLKVHGLKKLVKEFAKAVHGHSAGQSTDSKSKRAAGKVIFVNKTAPGAEWADIIDYHVAGDTDAWVSKVEEDWRKRRPQDWEVQTTLDGDVSMASPMKVVKAGCGAKAKMKGMHCFSESVIR